MNPASCGPRSVCLDVGRDRKRYVSPIGDFDFSTMAQSIGHSVSKHSPPGKATVWSQFHRDSCRYGRSMVPAHCRVGSGSDSEPFALRKDRESVSLGSSEFGSGRLQLNKVSGDLAGHLLTRTSFGLNVGAIASILVTRSRPTCAKCASRTPTIAAGSSWNSYRYAPCARNALRLLLGTPSAQVIEI